MKALALFVLVSLPAFAASFEVTGPVRIDLKTQSLSEGAAELNVNVASIEAKGGIRLEGAKVDFQPSVPILLDQTYVVRAADGRSFKLKVHARTLEHRTIELAAMETDRVEQPAAKLSLGVWKETAFSIDGVEGTPSGRVLRVAEGGRYRVGSTTGVIAQNGQSVLLEGAYELWGTGTLSLDGTQLRFAYRRNAHEFVVTLKYVEDATQGLIGASR